MFLPPHFPRCCCFTPPGFCALCRLEPSHKASCLQHPTKPRRHPGCLAPGRCIPALQKLLSLPLKTPSERARTQHLIHFEVHHHLLRRSKLQAVPPLLGRRKGQPPRPPPGRLCGMGGGGGGKRCWLL